MEKRRRDPCRYWYARCHWETRPVGEMQPNDVSYEALTAQLGVARLHRRRRLSGCRLTNAEDYIQVASFKPGLADFRLSSFHRAYQYG